MMSVKARASTVCVLASKAYSRAENELMIRLWKKDISLAFNYGQAMGSGQLLRFVTEHTEVYALRRRCFE